MATDSEVSDDSSSIATTPPSYHETISADPIRCSKSSLFPFRRMKQKRTAVLSRIRDIVLAPNFTPSSVTSNLNTCAAAIPAAEFSNILTQPNIEGHTALYWAIMNNRPQAFWAFHGFITPPLYPFVCSSDLLKACMVTNDHPMFTRISEDTEDMRLRDCLGCPPDKIRPPTSSMLFCESGCSKNACAPVLKIFGRIWWLRFILRQPSDGLWSAEIGLRQYSHPARLKAVLLIEAHSRKPGRATPPGALKIPFSLIGTDFVALAPWRSTDDTAYVSPPDMTWRISRKLGDWVMHDTTEYVDHEGTLHARLETTLL
ncbi:uncharacterized protein BJ212DRAFT_1372814 [Suillus subaureus]|uniref:Uncharacterized protein n=1 Tax=Suillus subaureus TaxID=48587 RepID=A0A9P7E5C6_9AGAM|nr:uncharacterized protein BJ212DRAFT_1372814 [Suillus subaureus]KAG1811752.1 hypothetical protein BJ212DRAFT_1372814 [Suillus subaureus]